LDGCTAHQEKFAAAALGFGAASVSILQSRTGILQGGDGITAKPFLNQLLGAHNLG